MKFNECNHFQSFLNFCSARAMKMRNSFFVHAMLQKGWSNNWVAEKRLLT